MKIKRFTAPDMRHALRKVREELGADAVILSNHRIAEGIEIVAAIDYDESLLADNPIPKRQGDAQQEQADVQDEQPATRRQAALDDIRYGRNLPVSEPQPRLSEPQNSPAIHEMQNEIKSLRSLLMNQLSGMAWEHENRLHPVRARLMQRLMAFGLSPRLAKAMAQKADETNDIEHNWRLALADMAHQIRVNDDDILEQGGIVALVGATGVGKTTTIAKLAARYILRHGPNSVALITTDNYRVAAHEQLRSYARIMSIPMRVANDDDALRDALASFRHKGLVLIDTAGTSQREVELGKRLSLIRGETPGMIKTYLTLATNSQRGVLDEVIRTFSDMPLAGCILTKVDETTSLGTAISSIIEHQLPVAYYSDGQQVPEDLHRARAHSLVTKSVTIMQRATQAMDKDEASVSISGMVASYG
ncbi:MAG: flagellar biosynthesis protein FlhF [Thioalkalispiraceae bacterium]|jgi:flagellar biosynthesis protein FlhF